MSENSTLIVLTLGKEREVFLILEIFIFGKRSQVSNEELAFGKSAAMLGKMCFFVGLKKLRCLNVEENRWKVRKCRKETGERRRDNAWVFL